MTPFTPGQRVFYATRGSYAGAPREGRYLTVERVSPTGIVTIGSDTFRADGRGRGKTEGRIREPMEGDDEAVRARIVGAISGFHRVVWARLSAADIDAVAEILTKAGVLT